MKFRDFLIFLVYVFFAIYAFNFTFKFLVLPTSVSSLNEWIMGVIGFLLLGGGINYLKAARNFY